MDAERETTQRHIFPPTLRPRRLQRRRRMPTPIPLVHWVQEAANGCCHIPVVSEKHCAALPKNQID